MTDNQQVEETQAAELYGTARLIAKDGNGEKGELILVPAPTADPNDPLNWSLCKKHWHVFLVSYFTFFSGSLVGGLVAAWGYTSADTGISITDLNYGYAIIILFNGVANVPWTIMANRWGRRPVYLCCTLGATLCSIWTGGYNNLPQYYARQVFMGIFTAPYEGMNSTLAGDLFFLHQRGLYMAVIFMQATLGTDLGNICSSFIASSPIAGISWRWIGWMGTLAFGINFLLVLFTFDETRFVRGIRPSHIDSNELAETQRLSTGGREKRPSNQQASDTEPGLTYQPLKSYRERLALWELSPPEYRQSVWDITKEIFTLFTFPAVIWAGCVYGINVSWYTVILSALANFIYEPPYNFTAIDLGYTRFGTIIGTIIAVLISGPLSDYLATYLARRNNGIREAEHRLPIFFLGFIFMPGALLLFGLCATHTQPWISIVIGEAMVSFSFTFVSEIAMNYVVDCYRPVAIEAFVGIIVIRNFFGFAFTFGISPWLVQSGIRDVSITCAVVTVVVYSSTIPMWLYGKRLRVWTSTRYPLAGRMML